MAWPFQSPFGSDAPSDNPWWDRQGSYTPESAAGLAADPMQGPRNIGSQVESFWDGAKSAGSSAYDAWQAGMAASPLSPQNVAGAASNRPPSIPEPAPPPVATTTPSTGGASAGDQMSNDLNQAMIEQIKNESRAKAAEAQLAEARVKELEDKLRRAGDPNSVESQTAAAQLQTAQTQLARSQQELAQLQTNLTPEQQIRLTDQLARERSTVEATIRANQAEQDRLARAAEAQAQRDFTSGENASNRQFQIELQNRQDQLARDRFGAERELRLYEIMMGQEDKAADRAMRQQELDYQRGVNGQKLELDRERLNFDKERAAQDFQLRMMAQKVAEGELSAKKAFQKFQQWIEKQRLPSEIARNKSAAYQPFLPYLTNANEGDIPMGFNAGGPMSRLTEMAGGRFDPKEYAIHPTTINDIKEGNTRPAYTPPAPGPVNPGGVPTPLGTRPPAEVVNRIKQRLG